MIWVFGTLVLAVTVLALGLCRAAARDGQQMELGSAVLSPRDSTPESVEIPRVVPSGSASGRFQKGRYGTEEDRRS